MALRGVALETTICRALYCLSRDHFFPILRMVNAQSLLERTTYNIKEISEIVGYENPLYFSRVFKKEIGKSPAQYRKEMIPTEAV